MRARDIGSGGLDGLNGSMRLMRVQSSGVQFYAAVLDAVKRCTTSEITAKINRR